MNLDRLITETLRRRLLVENAINNSRKAARDMVIAKTRCTEEYANNVVEEIRGLVGLEDKMRKFIKGCTRMFLNGELNDPQVVNDLKDALNKIKTDGHIGEFDSDLRRLDQPADAVNSAKDIIAIFKPKIDRERAEQRQKLSGMEFEPKKDYEIVKINSFEEARKYSRYTSWCVTKDYIHYNRYITNGINQFYFCLQNGFENIENDGDFGDKKDAYALSMLAILVNHEGELIHCTNRKNNDQGVLNPFEISELVGRNFYETFKPNTTWRDALEDVKNKLTNGVPVEEVFDDVRRNGDLVVVSLLERWNILCEGNTFLCDKWYNLISDFKEGFARVWEIGKGYNFINSDGNEICNRWYDNVGDFHEGFAHVEDEIKGYNLINRDGKEICNRWYDYAENFHEGFTSVKDETKGWKFINRDGKEICNRWYDYVGYFSEGFAIVLDYNKGYNFINSDGKEICDRWYDNVGNFREGFAPVKDVNKGWNFINRDGKEICGRWYDYVAGKFSEGFAMVKDKNKGWNFINHDGKEICNRWYDNVGNFQEGFAPVKDVNKGWNFINRDGKDVFGQWYDYVSVGYFSEGFAKVRDRTKGYNFINRDGKVISDRWYYCVWDFFEGFACVEYKGRLYWLRKDGVLCDYKTRKPLEDTPAQMAESLINRLVRGILFENKLKKKGKNKITPLNSR